MSIKNWPGGYIKPIPPTPAGPYQDSAAPGVWTLDQVAYWQKQGLWPTAGNIDTSNRGLFGAGYSSGYSTINVIEYISISTTGNSTDFGDLTVARNSGVGAASSTRGLFIGDGGNNTVDYVTISTTGNAIDFGDMGPTGFYNPMGASNSTRAVYQYGYNLGTFNNVIFYLTIASTGNGLDFGDLTEARNTGGGLASPTRAVFGGGSTSVSYTNTMDYVTIASTGDAVDFGDLFTDQSTSTVGCSSSTRGLWMGGFTGSRTNIISYITIASTGDATDFGDLTVSRSSAMAASSATRGVCAGGINSAAAAINVIDYVTIATTGNATDFGDLLVLYAIGGGFSNSHGGL